MNRLHSSLEIGSDSADTGTGVLLLLLRVRVMLETKKKDRLVESKCLEMGGIRMEMGKRGCK
jgi:hypothetical protein